MNKEKMVKKIMESPITIDNIKEVLISELKDDRVECIGKLEDLKLHDVSYYICEKLGEVECLDYREEYDLKEKKSMLLDEFLYIKLNTDEEYLKEEYSTKEDFIYMLNEYEDFLDTIEEIYEGYEYIRDFKENQVDIFKDWYDDVYKDCYGDVFNGEIE